MPRRTLLVLLVLLMGCSGDEETSPATSSATNAPVEATSSEVASPTPNAEAPSRDEAPNEAPNEAPAVNPTEAPAQNGAPLVHWGPITVVLERLESQGEDDVEGPSMILSEIAAQPKPDTAPDWYMYQHAGHMELRVIREVPANFETARVSGEGVDCEAQVVRALELHAYHSPEFGHGGDVERAFFALELRGCPGGTVGVAGVSSIQRYSLRRQDLPAPAPQALVDLVAESDNLNGWDPPLDAAEFRVRRFPELGFDVVAGHTAWVVRDGVVLNDRGGSADTLFSAGPLVLFAMSSTNDGWLASIDDFIPMPVTCTVSDATGTPLNVRAAPRRGAAIVDVRVPYENGEDISVYETRGNWRRISQTNDPEERWVHGSGVRCP
ncbi:MAG: SH3 domain-containing protein [Polyangiales bacterium]